MPAILRPDTKALVYLAIGYFVVPYVIKAVKR
jgi:hypothetical protein